MIKKIIAGILTATMIISASVPAMADNEAPQVFVNFLAGGQTTGKYVKAGSNVTAPSVPVIGGYTFCGYDKSLYNVTTNTTYTAVYVSDSLGQEAIKAKKASLPTPAITPTTVADPNAPMGQVDLSSAVKTATVAATAQTPAATPAAQQTALAALAQAQQAVTQAAAATDTKALQDAAAKTAATVDTKALHDAAVKAAATVDTKAVQDAAAAAAANVDTKAVQAAAAQVANQAVSAVNGGLPSWAVSLHGVSAAGAAEVYKYWKTVKNADDATIQANWDALLNHYAGHGTQGW